MKAIGHWVAGRTVLGTSGRTTPVYDPARGTETGEVTLATAAEVDDVVKVARDAAATWGTTSLSRRTTMMFRFRELLDGHRDDLAALITSEHGKVLDDAAGEVARGIECVEFACGIPHLLKGSLSARGVHGHRRAHRARAARRRRRHHAVQLPGHGAAVDARQRARLRQRLRAQAVREGPVGVAAARRARAARPACPTACSTSSRATPRRWRRSSPTPTSTPCRFVGSTPVARHIYETGTRNGKRVQALGGAKNHMVVLPDADLDAAADAAINAGLRLGGRAVHGHLGRRRRRCIADPLVDAIAARIPDVVIGPGDDDGLDDGPADHTRASRPGPLLRRAAPKPRVRGRSSTVPPPRRATGSSSAAR